MQVQKKFVEHYATGTKGDMQRRIDKLLKWAEQAEKLGHTMAAAVYLKQAVEMEDKL